MTALIIPPNVRNKLDLANAQGFAKADAAKGKNPATPREPQRRQIIPVLADDGRWVLPADLLDDCGPGQTWEAYGPLLTALIVEEVEVSPSYEEP